ncbi:MAG: HipA domain-containing protein [Oleispira sp.]|nr:HipA domain-containing protein [Oleispira sp.]MBL4880579.1 HipA domain-containing protein [Oleispira sp.]
MSELTYCKISLKKITTKTSKPGYNNSELKNLFGSTKIKPDLLFSRSEFFQQTKTKVQGMSISGVQQKLSLKVNNRHELEATTEGGEYILKPSPEAYPFAAENEHVAMLIHRVVGIETALCGLVDFKGGEKAYITKRFDKLPDGSKQHQEDLLQCFDLPSKDKYSKTYEEAGILLNEVTSGKQAVTLEFVRRVIMAYVIGNDDMHLKNISVQKMPNNKAIYYDKLTPSYDNLIVEALSSTQKSKIGFLALGLLHDKEDGDEEFSASYDYFGYYTGVDFIELAKRLGLKEKPVRKFITKLATDVKKIIDLVNQSFMPTEMKSIAKEVIESRIKALQNMDYVE